MEHQTGVAGVGDEQVAASSQNEQGNSAAARPGAGFDDFVFALGFNEPTRGTADAEGGERCKRLIFFEVHRFKANAFLRLVRFKTGMDQTSMYRESEPYSQPRRIDDKIDPGSFPAGGYTCTQN